MSDRPRQTLGLLAPGTLRSASSGLSGQQLSSLSSRVEAKRTELENLQQLRDASALLASRMQELEQKLSTLRHGTEGMRSNASVAMLDRKGTDDTESQGATLPTALVRIPVEPSDP
ncbi:hypothetical protein KEM54_003120 [Ascosphaera aggregata]|nr:hypothetical protein KEM54_003120 [Ascosphaera aggregata]